MCHSIPPFHQLIIDYVFTLNHSLSFSLCLSFITIFFNVFLFHQLYCLSLLLSVSVFKFAFNYNYFMLSFFALIFLSFFLSSSVGRIPFVSLYLLFYLSNYFLFCFNIPLKPYISIIFWPLPFYHLISISLKFV